MCYWHNVVLIDEVLEALVPGLKRVSCGWLLAARFGLLHVGSSLPGTSTCSWQVCGSCSRDWGKQQATSSNVAAAFVPLHGALAAVVVCSALNFLRGCCMC